MSSEISAAHPEAGQHEVVAPPPAPSNAVLSSHDDRVALAARVRAGLERRSPGSSTDLRGSVAAGTDDAVSDLDLAWLVPGTAFAEALDALPGALAEVGRVESLRLDPDTDPPVDRALVFGRFAGLPLFLRLDLEVVRVGDSTPAQPVAWAHDWSRAESALMNALATVKTLYRAQHATADGLLRRGFERIGAADPGGGWQSRIRALSGGAASADARLATLAAEVQRVAADLLPPD